MFRTLSLPLLAALLAWPVPACARESSITPEMDKLIIEGIDSLYRMDFETGEAKARKLIKLHPDHPHGYFGLAAVIWTKYLYGTESTDTSLVAVFDKAMNTSITKARAWLKKHPDDVDVLMVLGSNYGLKSRLLISQKKWIQAFMNGRKAIKIIKRCHKIDPEFYDAYLALGMYDYYTDTYSRLVKVVAKLVFQGSRERGIERLKIAAEKAHYGKNAAKMVLVEIYLADRFGGKDPKAAHDLMKDIRSQYPKSPMLHAAQLVAFYESGEYPSVLLGAEDYLAKVKTGLYPPLHKAKGNVIMATGQWAMGRKEDAFEHFVAASDVRVGDRRSRWSVWALIRAGQVADILGRREEASRLFRKASKEPDLWGLRKPAKKHVSKPYKKGHGPGPIQPPDT